MMSRDSFIYLIRLGIGHTAYPVPDNFDWEQIHAFATRHGLLAVVVDGIEQLPDGLRPPKNFLLEWIGEVLQSYECRYVQYCRAISGLAGFYNTYGYKMMVLKGYTCSLDWLKPDHRPCGDIDIWMFGKQKEVDALLAKEKGIRIDKGHHHHTVFDWQSFMVENHYDFVNVYAHSSSAEMEKELKELGENYSHYTVLYGETVYSPSPNLHALFLLKHAASHFASANINVRQVVDWGFFVEKHTDEIDWGWLYERLDYYHMKDFVSCLNAICVEDLGFNASIFHGVQFNPTLKDKVLDDILNPTFDIDEPTSLVPRLIYRIKRWKGNSWKHNLCYKESRWSAFWSGVWGHLIKPSSI